MKLAKYTLTTMFMFTALAFSACSAVVFAPQTYDVNNTVDVVIANAPMPLFVAPEPETTPEPLPVPPMPTEPEPEPYIPQGPRQLVALTFDDGPSRFTNYVLDKLNYHGAAATFFVLGNRIAPREAVVARMARLGNEVVGHSWNHANFAGLTQEEILWQLQYTSAAIEAVIGETPSPIFRPPYGIITDNVRYAAQEAGYAIVNWSVDTEDWLNRDADIIYARIMDVVRHGSIVLMHDLRPATVDAVERAIPSLIAQGFELVTVSELLEYVFEEITPGYTYIGLR